MNLNLTEFRSSFSSLKSDNTSQWLLDIETSWLVILACIGICFATQVLFFSLSFLVTGGLLWVSCLIYFLGIAYIGFLSYLKGNTFLTVDIGNGVMKYDILSQRMTHKSLAFVIWAFEVLLIAFFASSLKKIGLIKSFIQTS